MKKKYVILVPHVVIAGKKYLRGEIVELTKAQAARDLKAKYISPAKAPEPDPAKTPGPDPTPAV